MNTLTIAPSATTRQPMPRFMGVVRGELFKITRFRAVWIMGIALALILTLPWVALLLIPSQKAHLLNGPLTTITNNTQGNMALVRVFLGVLIAIVAVLAIGTDYQQGTIRIVLARGVARLQLLAAKAVALSALTTIALAVVFLWEWLLGTTAFSILGNGLGVFSVLGGDFWHQTAQYALTVVISTFATLIMAIAATVVGRSLAFGMAVALGFFPADNFGSIILNIIANITNNTFWLQVTRYLLGPNLNIMPAQLLPQFTRVVQTERGALTETVTAVTLGFGPQIADDFTHTVLVTLVWSLAFVAIATFVMWRRDVLE